MNHLKRLAGLANTYYVMRHGQSRANVAGIIVSRPETDEAGDYGLTEVGRWQVLAAAGKSGLGSGTLIYSSGFARARETAAILRACVAAPAVLLAPALRERSFGDWEGSDSANYETVWGADKLDPGHAERGVEPVTAVLDRATALVAEIEGLHAGRDVLLVSHGDPLQILQAGFQDIDPAEHRSLPYLGTAEIRRLACEAGRVK